MRHDSFSDLITRHYQEDLTTRCEIWAEDDTDTVGTTDTGDTIDINLQSRDLVERQTQQFDYGRSVTHIAYAETQTELKIGWRLVETYTKDEGGNWDAVTTGRTWVIEAFDRIPELSALQTNQVQIALHTTTTTDKVGTRA